MTSIQPAFVQRSWWCAELLVSGALRRLCAVAAFALLAGCEGTVTVDLSTEVPTDPDITQVVASLRGVEFISSSGNTETLEFTDSEQLDFMDYTDDDSVLRLFTGEELPEGDYTGVRLLFDEDAADDAFVTTSSGQEFSITFADGDYASVDLEIADSESVFSSSSSESFTLMLDLRQSLSFDDDNDEYTFTPVLRAVPTEDISSIEGDITVDCPSGDSLSEGAVYLFLGNDITPDDIDGTGIEPFATTPVFVSQTSGSFFYSLRVLPAGDYTIAVTCIGNDEDPATDEDLEFRNVTEVGLDEGEVLELDLP